MENLKKTEDGISIWVAIDSAIDRVNHLSHVVESMQEANARRQKDQFDRDLRRVTGISPQEEFLQREFNAARRALDYVESGYRRPDINARLCDRINDLAKRYPPKQEAKGVLDLREVSELAGKVVNYERDYISANSIIRDTEKAVLKKVAEIAGADNKLAGDDEYTHGWRSAMGNFSKFLLRKAD